MRSLRWKKEVLRCRLYNCGKWRYIYRVELIKSTGTGIDISTGGVQDHWEEEMNLPGERIIHSKRWSGITP